MKNTEKVSKALPDALMVNRNRDTRNWIIMLIKAVERCFRPPSRKRSVRIRLKKQTKNVLIEKEVEYKDEY
jgi:hypothetical protein